MCSLLVFAHQNLLGVFQSLIKHSTDRLLYVFSCVIIFPKAIYFICNIIQYQISNLQRTATRNAKLQ